LEEKYASDIQTQGQFVQDAKATKNYKQWDRHRKVPVLSMPDSKFGEDEMTEAEANEFFQSADNFDFVNQHCPVFSEGEYQNEVFVEDQAPRSYALAKRPDFNKLPPSIKSVR
jgi:hypothetical protein